MTSLLLDLRHAARVLGKNQNATAVAVITLALAIGATTAIFSVVCDFFTVLGIRPFIGRTLTSDDARVGADPVVIVTHRYWVESLGSANDLSTFHLRIENPPLHGDRRNAGRVPVSGEGRSLGAGRTR
jgi:hypothetical protein